jgi:hypothetical protein
MTGHSTRLFVSLDMLEKVSYCERNHSLHVNSYCVIKSTRSSRWSTARYLKMALSFLDAIEGRFDECEGLQLVARSLDGVSVSRGDATKENRSRGGLDQDDRSVEQV